MPSRRDLTESWVRLALAALFDPTPAGIARSALTEVIRLRQGDRPPLPSAGSLARRAARLARRVSHDLAPFLEHETDGDTARPGLSPAVRHTVDTLLAHHAPDARRINALDRDPRRIVRHVSRRGAHHLTGLDPHREVPLVHTVLRHTYRLLLQHPATLDALRADTDRRMLHRLRRLDDDLDAMRAKLDRLLRRMRQERGERREGPPED